MFKPSIKLWLKKGSKSVLGAGRVRLLQEIHKHGSITKAAKAMNMSYRHAWGILKHINESAGEDVVETTRGGHHGGGAKLTKLGEDILELYENYAIELDKVLKFGPKASLAVDGLIFDNRSIVLIRRKNPPFTGKLAFPGGFVEYNETTEDAVMREVEEELGIKTKIIRLMGVYSEPYRDPRHHTVSVVYELKPLSTKFKAGDDAAEFEKIPINNLTKLDLAEFAFDHGKIIFEIVNKRLQK
jgi:8-oxo-dGTP diphosphatase